MNINQELTPKYWVVNCKLHSDVLIQTAHKSRRGAINNMAMNGQLLYDYFGYGDYRGDELDFECEFEEHPDLECILVEIKPVVM